MNFFLPGFFNQIQTLPSNVLHQFDENLDNDTVSVSACLLAIIVLMTTVEALILISCMIYNWFQLPFWQNLWWLEDDEEYEEVETETERFSRIKESLNENVWTEVREACCSICLTNFQSNDVVVSGSTNCCRYVFHKKCLYRWLKVQSTCPCCRHPLLKATVENTKEETPTTTFSILVEDVTMSITPWTSEPRPEYPFDAWDFSFFLF